LWFLRLKSRAGCASTVENSGHFATTSFYFINFGSNGMLAKCWQVIVYGNPKAHK
jgi:hypothetical protein